jgi:serine/threonine-protein kinase RIO1
MSKKKNTLQDLDDFLKQQAATLVTPGTLSDVVEPTSDIKEAEVLPISHDAGKDIIKEFQISASKHDPTFRKKLYDFIIESLEIQNESLPEDKMLINTALYLKNGDDWKNAIRQYWRER